MKEESIVFYAVLAISAIDAIASILTLNTLLIASTSVLIVLAAFVYKMWYLVKATIIKRTGIVEKIGALELYGDRSSAIRRQSGRVSATAVAALHIDSTAALDAPKLEGMISRISYPFKISMQAERLNIGKILDSMQTKRNTREIELSRHATGQERNHARDASIKREISQLEHDIESITKGETPLRLAYYVSTSASSTNTYDAESKARSQIRELSSQFSALLGAKARILDGEELLQALQIDATMELQ